MDDLIAFLKGQLDAEEQVARAALQGWRTMPFGRSSEIGIYAEALLHAALYGPVRVLSEIEAKRQIIDCHQPNGDPTDPWHGNTVICRECKQVWNGGWDGTKTLPTGCRTLRLLALPYSSHPDYRSEWKP